MLKMLGTSVHSFLASALDDDGWAMLLSGRFTPRKEPLYPLRRRLGRPQDLPAEVRMRENLLPQPGFEPRTSQPLASRYSGYAIIQWRTEGGGLGCSTPPPPRSSGVLTKLSQIPIP
jgi:hypothetical protein